MSPAVVASLYSLILLSVATVMSRRRSGETRAGGSLFRGTGVSLCVVAFAMPMLRLVSARTVPDLLLLWGTMGAAVAVIAFLIRPRQPSSDAGESDEVDDDDEEFGRPRRTAREKAKRSRAAARVAVIPSNVVPSNVVPSNVVPLVASTPDGPTTERAADALHEVDLVVDDVAVRLGLGERRRP